MKNFGSALCKQGLWAIAALWLIVVEAGHAEVAVGGAGQWKTFGPEDGLDSGKVTSFLQDRSGALWIGTHGGLNRFDGQTWQTYTDKNGLPYHEVFRIFEDRDAYLWVCTRRGVGRYDGESWQTFTTEDGLAYNEVNVIIQDRDGYLWFGTHGGGVSRYDGREFKTFNTADGLAHNWVWDIVQDRDGDLWFGTHGGGVSRYDGERWQTFTTKDGLANNYVIQTLQDREGVLWFSTNGGGVSRYDGERWTTYTTEDGLAHNRAFAICQDRDGNLWIGTSGGGVSRYDGERWTTFTTEDGLANNYAEMVYQDRDGYMWFGTDGGGASRYDGRMFTTLDDRTMLKGKTVHAIIQDREDHLWFATGFNGVVRYDGREWAAFDTSDGLVNNRVSAIIQDRKGDFWFGTEGGGASRFDGQEWTTFTAEDGLASNNVESIYEDRDGNLWFATRAREMVGKGDGVSRYDGQEWTTFTTEDGLAHNSVVMVYQDRQGYYWFATEGGGVSRYDGETWTTFKTEDGLAEDLVRRIYEDRDGYLWFGTWSRGLSRYDGETFVNFSKEHGLADNHIRAIHQDETGRLWFATLGGGISLYDGRVFQTITLMDGLVSNAFRSLMQDREGCFWFGSLGDGVSRYCPPEPSNPPVIIDAIVANRRHEGVSEIAISTSVDLVEFIFHGISLKTRLGGMVYRYRLQGYDQEWLTNRSGRVEYKDLPAGDYVFEVLAIDRDLGYSEKPATVSLKVHWPYERIGLIASLCLALGLVFWQGLRIVKRDRKLQIYTQELEQSRQSAEEARDAAEEANRAKSQFLANMSHEIRTPMNAILGYAQILKRNSELVGNQEHAVDTILGSGEHLLSLINDVLDLSKIEAGCMELQMTDFDLSGLMSSLAVMFELRCRQEDLEWRLLSDIEEKQRVRGDEAKLGQVLINLLGNAVKFTQAGSVTLKLSSPAENRYLFEVIDTGVGIAPEDQAQLFEAFHQGATGAEQEGTGLGLSIAQRQVELMGGEIEVESEAGRGTHFFFQITLSPAVDLPVQDAVRDWSRVRRLASGQHITALIADDVAENRQILSQMLSGLGVDAEMTNDGKQALEALRRAVPRIAFLDIRMPELDGLQVLQQLREDARFDALKTVAISASVLDHQRQEFLDAGFDAFIAKPFRFEDLCRCLYEVLGAEFEWEVGVEETIDEEGDVAWDDVVLPAELLASLREAAEFYRVTDLEKHVQEVEALGGMAASFGGHLRTLRQQHNMEEIIHLLSEINHD